MLKIIEGNLLDSPDTYIAHQCNCVTKKVSGVAKAIFDKWDVANDNERGTHANFGEVKMHVAPGKYILNMFTQHNTGDQSADKGMDREHAFGQALIRMVGFLSTHSKKHNLPLTISFPYLIGCGLAGGNWDHYSTMLGLFAEAIEAKGGKVTLYRLEEK
jgi:hypothetical protein